MSHVGYLVVGWGGSSLVLGTYAAFLIVRGRTMAARVPVARRRWMTSEERS
jgi:hypothetical protein